MNNIDPLVKTSQPFCIRVLSRIARFVSSGFVWPWGRVTTQRLTRTLAVYLAINVFAVVAMFLPLGNPIISFAFGAIIPGAGFLNWAPLIAGDWFYIPIFVSVAIACFAITLVLWFATGNAFLPPTVWLLMAIGAMLPEAFGFTFQSNAGSMATTAVAVPLTAAIALGVAIGLQIVRAQSATLPHRVWKSDTTSAVGPTHCAIPQASQEELRPDDLQLQRLLLDRALQPIKDFNGFDKRDQFQTAALRYQINFVSYALASAAARYLPALKGYQLTAQKNLAEKLRAHEVWSYWQVETAWGHGRTSADPMPHQNIMYSGFAALQLALARSVHGVTDFDLPGSFILKHPRQGDFSYSLPEINAVLQAQYSTAPVGLLACEPNWIYPLCNAITVAGMRCSDTQYGSRRWQQIKERFQIGLAEEFMTSNGRLVSCRSSYTGLALPGIGGVTMQALPCLFFNSVLPELASQQWFTVRDRLLRDRGRAPFWFVDTGNYAMSRASNYAATAAAAAEMGDSEITERTLEFLNTDHPMCVDHGVGYRDGVSIWAHATEFFARTNSANGFRALVSDQGPGIDRTPCFKDARYPDLLFARATYQKDALEAVIYPGAHGGFHELKLSNLKPRRSYQLDGRTTGQFYSDGIGEAKINVELNGRTEVRISETA